MRGAAALSALAGVTLLSAMTLLSGGAAAQTPPAPPTDAAIDARIRASADAAQAYQGRLDGAWTLVSAAGGKPIYAFQLVEKANATDPLEGVWRDLRLPSMPGDIGLIDTIVRTPTGLTIAFAAKPGGPRSTIELRPSGGGWTGGLMEGGVLTRVRLRHW